MANKLIMTTIFAASFLIFALLPQLSTATEHDEHIQSYLFPGECEISSVYACMFYLSGEKEVAYRFNPVEDELQKQRLSDCCDELQKLEQQECRCTAIEQIVKLQFQNRCWDEEEKMNVVRAAINLPERCQLQPRFCIVSFTGSPSIC